MNTEEELKHLQTRLKSLVKLVEETRNAQTFYFSIPRSASDTVKSQALSTSKRKEQELDAFIKMVKFEKLV